MRHRLRWDGTRCIHQERTGGAATTAMVGSSRSVAKCKVVDVTVGTGKEAGMGDLVSVDYTASLTDGTVVDSSRPRGKPLQFRSGQVKSSRASSAASSG